MNFGVQLYSLRDFITENGLEQALDIISKAGFTGVEFAGFYGKSAEEIATLLNRYHLTAISAHVGVDEISEQLPILKALGIQCVIIPWLPFNIGISFEEGLEKCCKAEALLKENGLILGYHNHAHEFLNGTDIVDCLSKKMPDLRLELDVFWLAVAKVDALKYIDEHHEKLIYLHIKELGESAEDINPVLGEGNAKIAEVIERGKKYNVNWAILEIGRTKISMEEYLQRSYKFIEKLK